MKIALSSRYRIARSALKLVVPLLAVPLLGCDSGDDTTTTTTTPEFTWTEQQANLPGMMLSVWGSADAGVWAVGDDGTNNAPVAVRYVDGAWTPIDVGGTGGLWWVYGAGDDYVWMVGDEGRIIRYTLSDGTITPITTTTTATLFGIWGPPGGPMIAVGGFITPNSPPPVAVKVEGTTATEIPLPATVLDDEYFFKVWGCSADDYWIITDMGGVMHWNGTEFTRSVLPDSPRLVTIHGAGCGGDDVERIIVGGATNGEIYEQNADGAWANTAPDFQPGFMGVYVTAPGGHVCVSGMANAVLQRGADGWGVYPQPSTQAWDWHACWIDETGATYLAGGDFFGLAAGQIYRFGP